VGHTGVHQINKRVNVQSDTLDTPPHIRIVMRDNGWGIGKQDLHKNEYNGVVPVKNTRSPGATCLMIISVKSLDSRDAMASTMHNLLTKFHRAFKYADQGLINMVFRNSYMVLWPCTKELRLVSPDNPQVKRGWASALCNDSELIAYHDYTKKCLAQAYIK